MKGRVLNIQILRGVAALLIVLYHILLGEKAYAPRAFLLSDLLSYGACGVDLFFLISGFVLTAGYLDQAGSFGACARFLVRRLARIYPLYWILSGALLAVVAVRPGLVDSSVYANVDLVKSFLLFPQRSGPLLSVAWAVSHLLYFYAVFALILAAGRRRFVPGLAGWLVLVVVGYAWREHSAAWRALPLVRLAAHPMTAEFILGCLLALVVARTRRGARAAVIGGSLLLAAACLGWYAGHGVDLPRGWYRPLLFGLPGALILYGAAAAPETDRNRLGRALRTFGDASYSLYLSHTLVISAVGRCWLAFPSAHAVAQAVWLVGMLTAALVVGLLTYHLLELPLVRRAKREQPRSAIAATD
jgi:peptidoglycan/LPS O-acetylase OafA/YrhL